MSCSVFDKGAGKIQVASKSLTTVMGELGHNHIDLLKLDIEGSEYSLLESMLGKENPILPTQVLVEFHDSLESELVGH